MEKYFTTNQQIDIRVLRGNEYRTLIMDIYNKHDFFYDTFTKAAAVVTEIVDRSIRYKNQKKFKSRKENLMSNSNFYSDSVSNYPNNILSFCAERGQGKTSAMLSLSRALRNIYNEDEKIIRKQEFWNDKKVKASSSDNSNPVLNTRFEILNPIDPTVMEESDSIVKSVISKMFKSAEEKWNNYISNNFYNKQSPNADEALKEKLLRKFVLCFRGADRLEKCAKDSSEFYDNLNLLAEYGDSTNFKKQLSELVEMYLSFTDFEGVNSDAMLVIQIDDADLNIRNAHAISEEIRKYFVMPNVIVLMAMNISTMRYTIEQYFITQFDKYLERGHSELVLSKCHENMEKYIEKLLPTSHRINIPKVDDYIRDGFNFMKLEYIDYSSYNQEDQKKSDDLAAISKELVKNNAQEQYYQEKLIMLIYQKTGIILVNPKNNLHWFLPSNMRMLNHFMTFLSELDNVIYFKDGKVVGSIEDLFYKIKECKNNNDEDGRLAVQNIAERYLVNLRRFLDFFINSWCHSVLSEKQMHILEQIYNASREEKNQRAVELLKKYAIEMQIEAHLKPDDSQEETKIDSQNTAFFSTPFSLVIEQLIEIKKINNQHNTKLFLYAVEMYYTICFNTLLMESIKSWVNTLEDINKNKPFDELIKLLGYSVFPLSRYDDINLRKMFFANPEGTYKGRLNYYSCFMFFLCEYAQKTKCIHYSEPVVKKINNDFIFLTEKSYFDVFRPIIFILDESVSSNFLNSDGGYDYSIISSAIRIVCNVDLQNLIFSKLPESIKTGESTQSTNFFDSISGLYEYVDEIINSNCIMSVNSKITEILKKDADNRYSMVDNKTLICFSQNGDSLCSVFHDSDQDENYIILKKTIIGQSTTEEAEQQEKKYPGNSQSDVDESKRSQNIHLPEDAVEGIPKEEPKKP